MWYLDAVQAPRTRDNGIWEEEARFRASSLGAVLPGCRQAARMGLDVPESLSGETWAMFHSLLPRESPGNQTDMALLTLVWSFGEDLDISEKLMRHIVTRVENELLGRRGVLRYPGDPLQPLPRPFTGMAAGAWIPLARLGTAERTCARGVS